MQLVPFVFKAICVVICSLFLELPYICNKKRGPRCGCLPCRSSIFIETVRIRMKIDLSLNCCIPDNFSCVCCRQLNSFKNEHFQKKIFQELYQSVKRFGFRSGTTFCWSLSASKLLKKVIRGRRKSLQQGKW